MTRLAHLESAAELTAILNAAPTAVIVVNETGQIVLVNGEGERLFGYTAEELLGTAVEGLLPVRMRHGHPVMRAQFMQAPATRPMGAGRALYGLRKDGSEFPMEIGLSPLQTDAGMLVISAIVDISTRQRLEARFRAAVESAPVAMVMIDASGSILMVNAELERLFGHQREQLLHQQVEVLIPQRFRHAHPGMRGQFFHSPESRRMGAGRELFAQRADGSEFPVEIGLNPIRSDEGVFVIAAIIDQSERKQAEADLHQSEERHRSVVESSSDAIITETLHGEITSWNHGAERMFGYSADEAVGQTVQILLPPEQQSEEAQLRELAEKGTRVSNYEALRRHKDGQLINVSIALSQLRDRAGVVIGVCKIVRDISAQSRAREAMQHALAEKTSLLHEVHHRVKNNLQIVSSLLNLQMRRESPEVQRALMESQGRIRAMALVHQLLYESNSVAQINLTEYLHRLVSLIASAYGTNSGGINLSFASSTRAVSLDIQRAIPCGLVITEIIINAIKHAFPGRSNGKVVVSLRSEADGAASICVSDDGVGLPADFSWDGPGGLGKQLIPMFVAQLHGELQHDSSDGARFVISFQPEQREAGHA